MVKKIVAGGHEYDRELCRALGEDPALVRSITLRSTVNEPIMVEIVKFVDGEDKRLIEVIKKYAWITDDSETVVEDLTAEKE